MDLLPGTYQNILGFGVMPYLPSGYGVLVVNDSGIAYKSYFYTSTDNITWYRICHKNDRTWYGAWQELALNSKMIWDYSTNVITANEEGIATISLSSIGLDTPLVCISFHASGNNFGGYYVCSVDYYPREISKGTHNAPAGTNLSVTGFVNALVFTISAPSLPDMKYTVTVSANKATYGR